MKGSVPTFNERTVVIGGGFYGCCLSIFLSQSRPEVLLIEKGSDLLTRASYINQARVHGGYHYPRSFMTALRSFVNLPRFCLDFRACIEDRFEKVYAIARSLSKVNAFQFRKFCDRIGAPVKPVRQNIRRLFDESMVEEVFYVQEHAFDALKLRHLLKQRLQEKGIKVLLNTEVLKVLSQEEDGIRLELFDGTLLEAWQVYNCTYSNINTLLKRSGLPLLPMKHEVTEIALVEVPEVLKGLGVTVMDGPFFSVMPFPPERAHSLSHVRYTPHERWFDDEGFREAYAYLKDLSLRSNYVSMWKDAQRYLPILSQTRYIKSLYEVKTVLQHHEVDDGRPILLERHPQIKNLITVMGGKIDNIYDVLQALQRLEGFSRKRDADQAQGSYA
jgi:glycine/D-amino acid oxidase-like deaminating enzyme